MATGKALFGKIRGRLGGAVYRVQDGMQIISEYNPAPLNPKTHGQSMHRIKFGLAAHVAAIFPYGIIAGYGIKPVLARAAFVKSLVPLATVDTTDPDNPVARLNPADMVLSRGSLVPAIDCDAALGSDNTSISLRAHFSATSGVTQVQFAVVIYDRVANKWQGGFFALADVNEQTGVASTSVQIMDNVGETEGLAYCYAIPIKDRMRYIATNYGRLTSSGNGQYLTTDVAISLSTTNAYCDSIYIDAVDTRHPI